MDDDHQEEDPRACRTCSTKPSRCTEELKLRNVKNDQLKAEAKAKGEVISTKRKPEGPKPGFEIYSFFVHGHAVLV
ncbi:60S ribosomal protein L21 [Corchorus olitorius]|uniref:60S ribosomal protein L21 n=1 Tax=Corchorus olitorius TaxID=93759 RepID=A0A1R3G010_9ROSI|nr:60S ribosomal protein L21 [Corchorus olitorius]